MQMRHYVIKYALICIYLKKKTKSEYWIKPGYQDN